MVSREAKACRKVCHVASLRPTGSGTDLEFATSRSVIGSIAGCVNQHQLQIIDYLREENRVLREQPGGHRVRFSDDQRRRLAAKAKRLGRRILAEVATIVTPETLLAWHRKLIAQKYDGSPSGNQAGPAPLRRPRLWCFAWRNRIAIGLSSSQRRQLIRLVAMPRAFARRFEMKAWFLQTRPSRPRWLAQSDCEPSAEMKYEPGMIVAEGDLVSSAVIQDNATRESSKSGLLMEAHYRRSCPGCASLLSS